MELRIISSREELSAVERIYTSSFPDEERAPMRMLKTRARTGRGDFLAAVDDEKIIGMAYVVCLRDLAYLFYLAIDKDMRAKGYGTKTVRALMKRYSGRRFFLALEQLDENADNYAERVRRHEFYKSCGLHDLPFKIKEATVIFSAMGVRLTENGKDGGAFTILPEEYKELTDRYLGFFMRHIIDMRLLP